MEKSLLDITKDDLQKYPLWNSAEYLDDYPEYLIQTYEEKIFCENEIYIIASKFVLHDGACFTGYIRYSFHEPMSYHVYYSTNKFMLGAFFEEVELDEDFISFSKETSIDVSNIFPIEYQHNIELKIKGPISSDAFDYKEDIGNYFSKEQKNYSNSLLEDLSLLEPRKRIQDLLPSDFEANTIWMIGNKGSSSSIEAQPYPGKVIYMGGKYLILVDIKFRDNSIWTGVIDYEPYREVQRVGIAINENQFIWYSYSVSESKKVKEKNRIEFAKVFGKKAEDVFTMIYTTKPYVTLAGITQ